MSNLSIRSAVTPTLPLAIEAEPVVVSLSDGRVVNYTRLRIRDARDQVIADLDATLDDLRSENPSVDLRVRAETLLERVENDLLEMRALIRASNASGAILSSDHPRVRFWRGIRSCRAACKQLGPALRRFWNRHTTLCGSGLIVGLFVTLGGGIFLLISSLVGPTPATRTALYRHREAQKEFVRIHGREGTLQELTSFGFLKLPDGIRLTFRTVPGQEDDGVVIAASDPYGIHARCWTREGWTDKAPLTRAGVREWPIQCDRESPQSRGNPDG